MLDPNIILLNKKNDRIGYSYKMKKGFYVVDIYDEEGEYLGYFLADTESNIEKVFYDMDRWGRLEKKFLHQD